MIGLFLGDTDFPKIVLKRIKKLKKKYFIIDFSKNNLFAKEKNSYRISIGKFGKIIDLIKKQKSNKVLFAGKIAKPKFSALRLDLKGIYYMPSIIKAAKLGDAAIIKAIIEILKNEKIEVISSIYFNSELTARKGNYTNFKPSRADIKSINRGIRHLAKTNSYDHIQALIVKDNKMIVKEDNRGTRKMMSKLKKNSGGILIKFPKKKQDLRMDLPTIGIQTIKDCKKYGLKGIVLKSKKNIFLDKSKSIEFANKNKIFILIK
ncbi:UDP-2,3-diacylglucosamine diphosphatase LpxI domain-containing protein [Candidatus Pelagibacter sp.]|uniref:UDP-2,3-diacylglucosamine diphosphatase LpxI domain-containing protein n=1 Tax=Candidatus Pelagibacter sp. TaxID=2024849 RepID=UPI003F84641C